MKRLFEWPRVLQDTLRTYVQRLIDDEWARLADDQLSPEAERLFNVMQVGFLNLEVTSAAHETLRDRLLVDIDDVSDYRQIRLHHAKTDPPIFVLIAIFGFMLTMAMLAVYPPTPTSITLMSFYCAFVGVVLYFIVAMNHPFDGPAQVTARPFEVITEDYLRPDR